LEARRRTPAQEAARRGAAAAPATALAAAMARQPRSRRPASRVVSGARSGWFRAPSLLRPPLVGARPLRAARLPAGSVAGAGAG
ncbi:MAG TPA: hypothetical protein VIM84_08185, partial [Gemmatimonadales bacterium]